MVRGGASGDISCGLSLARAPAPPRAENLQGNDEPRRNHDAGDQRVLGKGSAGHSHGPTDLTQRQEDYCNSCRPFQIVFLRTLYALWRSIMLPWLRQSGNARISASRLRRIEVTRR